MFNKNNFQDHFEKLYITTTEASQARISARLNKQADRENDDPYDPYKFDRIRVDEADIPELPKKQHKTVVQQQKRTKPTAVPSKICENGK